MIATLLTTVILCAACAIVASNLRAENSPYWFLPLVGWVPILGAAFWIASKFRAQTEQNVLVVVSIDLRTADEKALDAPGNFAQLGFVARQKGWTCVADIGPGPDGRELIWAIDGDPQTRIRLGTFPVETGFAHRWSDFQALEVERFRDRLDPKAQVHQRTLELGEFPCFELKGINPPEAGPPVLLIGFWIGINGTHATRLEVECGHAKRAKSAEAAYEIIAHSLEVTMGRA